LGVEVMQALRHNIRNCPQAMVLPEAGHFVQEHGEVIAKAALKALVSDTL
jgi:tRNA(adenine34) deaminase